MKNESDVSMMTKIKNTLGYTGLGYKPSKRKIFLLTDLPAKVAEIENRNVAGEESDSFGRNGMKNVIPSNIIGVYTRLKVLHGLKLSGHTDTLTEASNLVDKFCKRREIQN